MPRIEQKVIAELENIDGALRLIPDDIQNLSTLEQIQKNCSRIFWRVAGLGDRTARPPSLHWGNVIGYRFS